VTQLRLHPTCDFAPALIGGGETNLALVTAEFNPQKAIVFKSTHLEITSAGFAGSWHQTIAGPAVSTGAIYDTILTTTDTVTVYVSAVFGGVNYGRVPVRIEPCLGAFADYAATLDSKPIVIPVLKNDFIPVSCTPVFELVPGLEPLHGNALVVAPDSISYSPAAGFVGLDSLSYRIVCGIDTAIAKVYIVNNKSLALQYVACPGAVITMGFVHISGVEYYWYNAETVGTLEKTTASDTIRREKDSPEDIGTWWVEPRYKGKVFPRYQVDLLAGDCEVTDPAGCATNGTVIWKENFDGYDDGNNPASPAYSRVGLAPGMTTYTFSDTPDGMIDGAYALVKDAMDPASYYYLSRYRDDHTSPGDATRGRFLITNGATTPDLVYHQEINNLCSDMDLYFSFWMIGSDAEIEWTIYETSSDKVLAKFKQKKLSGLNLLWQQYGFKFPVPAGVTSIRFEIYNYCDVYSGNDVVYDDIEVRFCAPPVNLNVADTTVCTDTKFELVGKYDDDGTFGSNFTYRWEYHGLNSTVWTNLEESTSGAPLNDTLRINPVTKADEGYYRLLVSSPTNIGNVNCRAASDSILVMVTRIVTVPDIRVDICPSPAKTIYLSSFLDSLDFTSVLWTKTYPTIPAIDPTTGAINTGAFTNATFTYRYLQQSFCGTSSAIAYVHPLKKALVLRNDTIVVCQTQELSKHVQLNQIVGLDPSGTWIYPLDPNSAIVNNVNPYPSGSAYSGALIFNAQKAWADASTAYNITYKGDVNAKKFVFQYTPPGSCVGTKTIVIIVTSTM